MKKHGLALILAAALLLGAVPVPPARADAAAGDTIGGADTALAPVQTYALDRYLYAQDAARNGLTPQPDPSGTITVRYLKYKGSSTVQQNVTLDLTDCLVGITYNELGSILGYNGISAQAAAEAWRAQAITVHSYLLYLNACGSASNALIYADPAAIPETTRTALYAAIQPVENCILVYGSGTDTANYAICDAVWSCSGGYNTQTGVYGTCAGLDAWGTDTPYLQSVRSPYERIYHEKLRSSIGRDYTYREANDSRTGQPYQSADTSHKSLGGYVRYGTLVSNGVSYLYLNQFVSSRYCFDFDAGAKIMNYCGWGHGVGMTQCGAVGYAAEEGYNWMQILAHYYTGTSIYRQDTAALRVICDKVTDSAYARGDVDRDGAVTVRDALLCACCLAGRRTMDAGQNALGDVNGDGTMDAADLAGIARLLTGSAAG